jgi:GIY-YIG catalytic domain
MSVPNSSTIHWQSAPPVPQESQYGVIIGEWPCTFVRVKPENWASGLGPLYQPWHVYTLLDYADRVCYVGQTANLSRRLRQHGRNKVFAWWFAFPTSERSVDKTRQIASCRPYLLNDDTPAHPSIDSREILRSDILDGLL